MYTLYLRQLGEVTLCLDTIRKSRHFVFVTGYDDGGNCIEFIMDKFCALRDSPYDYGYCHIRSYVKNGICTKCNIYRALG